MGGAPAFGEGLDHVSPPAAIATTTVASKPGRPRLQCDSTFSPRDAEAAARSREEYAELAALTWSPMLADDGRDVRVPPAPRQPVALTPRGAGGSGAIVDAATTTVVFDFDCTLSSLHMYQMLRDPAEVRARLSHASPPPRALPSPS